MYSQKSHDQLFKINMKSAESKSEKQCTQQHWNSIFKLKTLIELRKKFCPKHLSADFHDNNDTAFPLNGKKIIFFKIV